MRGFLCAATALFAATSAVAQPPAAELRLGMLKGMFRDVQPAVVQAMSKPFRQLIATEVGYTGQVELCGDALTLTGKLKDKSVQIGVFHGFEFAWARTKCPDLVPLIVTRPPGGKVQAVVVVAKDAEYKSLADLKDEPVALPRGSKAHAIAFLDKLRTGFEPGTAKPVTQKAMTGEDVLTRVILGEFPAAAVDVAVLDGYQKLHPGAYKHLRVLHRSEEFPAAVVAYRKGTLTEAEAARIRAGLTNAEKTPSGKLLMAMWNLNGFEEPPAAYQGQLDAILKAYPCPSDGDPADARAAGGK